MPIDNSILEGRTGVWILNPAAVERATQVVSAVLHSHGDPASLIPLPSAGDLAHMVNAAYWASILPNEQRFLCPSLVYASRIATNDQVTFKRPVTLTAETLAKFAPAQPPGSHFWITKGVLDELQVFAVTQSPPAGTIVRVVGPGQVVVQVLFKNVAAFRRREFIDLTRRLEDGKISGVGSEELEIVLAGLFEGRIVDTKRRHLFGKVLSRIVPGIQAHGHGGTLVVVPASDTSESWRGLLDPSWTELIGGPSLSGQLEKLVGMSDEWSVGQHMANDHGFLRAVRTIARLTAVDGATILDDQGRILGFGAKIRMPTTIDAAVPVTVTLWSELAGHLPREVAWGELGGTRHLSAALFAAQSHDAVVLVSSMDGPTKALAWSATAEPQRVAIWRDLELMLIPQIPH